MKQPIINLLVLLVSVLILSACEKPFEYNVDDIPFFAGLEAPNQGEGYQIHVAPFPVPANYERELFVRMAVGNTEEIYVNKF